MKVNFNEKLYWSILFGKVEVVSVKFVVKMLRKKMVQDINIRIKIVCFAFLFFVFLLINFNMKIMRQYAEAIEDIDEFFRFIWGRMAFDMLMFSIKERDEIVLFQKFIVVKGFVLVIQLVVVELVLSLIEVVVEYCFSFELDSDNDVDECRYKFRKKYIFSFGYVRFVDFKFEVDIIYLSVYRFRI